MSDSVTEPDVDEFDDRSPDPHATPEQVVLLDRVIAILDRNGGNEGPLPQEDAAEWRQIIKDLHKTIPGLYGTEWIHRNWNIDLHGDKMFTLPWTREEAKSRQEFWDRLMSAPLPHYKDRIVTKSLPEGNANLLK